MKTTNYPRGKIAQKLSNLGAVMALAVVMLLSDQAVAGDKSLEDYGKDLEGCFEEAARLTNNTSRIAEYRSFAAQSAELLAGGIRRSDIIEIIGNKLGKTPLTVGFAGCVMNY